MGKEEYEEEDYDEEPIDDEVDTPYVEGDTVSNPLELATKTLNPSKIVAQLPEILKETKIAFLKPEAAKEIKHAGKNYDALRYIKKILKLQKLEDDKLIKIKRTFYLIRNEEQLKIYLKGINRSYLFNLLKQSGDVNSIVREIPQFKPNGMADDIQKITDDLEEIYQKYHDDNIKSRSVDDSGMIARIAMESVASSGMEGNERLALISTISATRNIDVNKETKIEQRPGLVRKATSAWRDFTR